MSEDYGKLFVENMTSEIRSQWIWRMRKELPIKGQCQTPELDDSGLKSFVSEFINAFCLLNGAAPGVSQEEALHTITSNVRDRCKSNGQKFYFGLFTEMIIDKSFGDYENEFLVKKYISTLKIPDTCKHSSWRDFDGIYDKNDNLKLEYRTEEEIEIDEKYATAGRQVGKRKKKVRNGSSSYSLTHIVDNSINPILATATEEVSEVWEASGLSGGTSKEEKRQRWWDKLIGPQSRKRVCHF